MTIQAIETAYAGCRVPGCERRLCARPLCRLHWERQHRTGTTDKSPPRTGPKNPAWKGDAATYCSVHLRMSTKLRPETCADCGTSEGRFEWALKPDVDRRTCLMSPAGYPYSTDPADYINLCKPCHNRLDHPRPQKGA